MRAKPIKLRRTLGWNQSQMIDQEKHCLACFINNPGTIKAVGKDMKISVSQKYLHQECPQWVDDLEWCHWWWSNVSDIPAGLALSVKAIGLEHIIAENCRKSTTISVF